MGVINKDVAGVYRKETDVSNNVTVAGTSAGAIVVRAPKGPINREVIKSDYPSFVDTFGSPIFSAGQAAPVFGYGHYAAEEFLKESNELHVVRIIDSGDKYPSLRLLDSFTTSSDYDSADIDNTGISASMTPDVPDTDTTIQSLDAGLESTDKILFGAQGPGIDGNNIAVTVETFNASCDWLLAYDDYPSMSGVNTIINSATAGSVSSVTSLSAALDDIGYSLGDILPVAMKVVKINIYTKKDSESWTTINTKLTNALITFDDLTPVETWYGTITFQKDAKNSQLRLKEIINGKSKYIYVATGSSQLDYEILPTTTKLMNLAGGTISYKDGTGDNDGTAVTTGWTFFANRELSTVNILVNPDWNTTVKQQVDQIAATRMDCIAVGQVGAVGITTIAGVLAAEQYGYVNPSYIALYAGWDERYDQSNDRNIFIPKAIFGAALMARVDRTGNTWDAPAGDPNGILPSFNQNKIFTLTEIEQLQKAGINTSKQIKSLGHVMWGQKTAQIKDTALNRISTRRLLLYIENSVEISMIPFLFNIVNNEQTRLRISTLINGFLSPLKGGQHPGLTAGLCVCDENNNTADIIDAEQLVLNLFVTPAKPVEIIQLNTIITKTGVNFNEILL
jgi:phage tail sheath protein FI